MSATTVFLYVMLHHKTDQETVAVDINSMYVCLYTHAPQFKVKRKGVCFFLMEQKGINLNRLSLFTKLSHFFTHLKYTKTKYI